LRKFILKLRNYFFRDILNRLNDTETAVHVLINDPAYKHDARNGFNGLAGRKRIFQEILNHVQIERIIETGTYLGNTTGYMATMSNVQVLSCEKNSTLYDLARFRLKDMRTISLEHMDSIAFLNRLAKNHEITVDKCFFYLDAHWGKDVPLREEIAIIASNWKEYVIMIDDFKVPDDSGYGFGSYGTLEQIDMPSLHQMYGLCASFPAIRSDQETQPPTGCVVLMQHDTYVRIGENIKTLRLYFGHSQPA